MPGAPAPPSYDPSPPVGARPPRRVPLALATWALIVVVLGVIVVLLILKITQGADTVAGSLAGPAVAPAPAAVVDDATSVPAAVYDEVGAPGTSDTMPVVLSGQPVPTVGGLPAVVFVGGEFCPFCAAERWAVVTALARFGTFAHLGATSSAANQVFPKTATFTFDGTTFTSHYVALQLAEAYADAPSQTAPAGVARLDELTTLETNLLRRYGTETPGGAVLPFLDVANRLVATGAQIGFTPAVLSGTSMGAIAGALSDPTDPGTEAILGAANEITAAICQVTGQRPVTVCAAPGTRVGAARLGLG